jgi:hypothetical protein
MIDDKLKELGEYAEELEKEEPFDLLYNYINQVTRELENVSEFQSSLGEEFSNDVIKVVKGYTGKDLLTSLVSYHLLSVLVGFVKKSMVENKANSLGIEKNLFKQKMRFLFKGRWK